MSHVKNVAIVGATGTIGSYIVAELLKAGKHQITAVTRQDSNAIIPNGVNVVKVDYTNHSSLVAALRGQDVLVITMSVKAPKESQIQLIDAAADAGVRWILPNEWGLDKANEPFADAALLGPRAALGVSDWVGVVCGFWYDFSLGGSPARYGFDFNDRSVLFFDNGTQPINTTTFPQVGRAVARLLDLPTTKGKEGMASLADFRNNYLYISSFCVSQKDMLESVLRVTDTRMDDWAVRHEDSAELYAQGLRMMKEGNMVGFIQAMYVRTFFPNDDGNFGKTRGLHNELLGLPVEDIDEFTRLAITRKDDKY
ncbi:NAD(P)-binding protein [Apiospora kogelbergensis]|uniref:NAD(P)-binding protein n=1 Tax=Apiospora kogelbergensis TaxID=1337665 RepID=A0AAW0QEV9_9PEZI